MKKPAILTAAFAVAVAIFTLRPSAEAQSPVPIAGVETVCFGAVCVATVNQGTDIPIGYAIWLGQQSIPNSRATMAVNGASHWFGDTGCGRDWFFGPEYIAITDASAIGINTVVADEVFVVTVRC